jgi:hypothetical protein
MKNQKWTKQLLIDLYKKLSAEKGHQLTRKEWINHAETPSDMPVRCLFKNWNFFVKESGYEPKKPYISDLARENSRKSHLNSQGCAWKGGKIKDNFGYIQIWMPDHPNSKSAGYIHEHRYVMSQFLKRPLKPNENVHHKNGKRDDNRIENLELWVKPQPNGQRLNDLILYYIEFLEENGYEVKLKTNI